MGLKDLLPLGVCLLVLLFGCSVNEKRAYQHDDNSYAINAVATQIEYPDVQRSGSAERVAPLAPRTLDDAPPNEFWELTLDEAIRIALDHSKIIRTLGGRVLTNPAAAPTTLDPAIQESDPFFGPEGALSAFDAQLATSLFWTRNDHAVNNAVTVGGIPVPGQPFEIRQDIGDFQAQLTKTAAPGTQFTIRHQTQYDANNSSANLFPSGWTTQFEASVTQPLLRGAGTKFNRIAGPNANVGLSNSSGVLLARINTDVTLADFEAEVRNFISEVEDAYWDLYFAYRDLDAKKHARDSALETWKIENARFIPGAAGASREAQARLQYHSFQRLVQDTFNGAPIGTQSVGVLNGERNLRLLMGIPINDGKLIRPADEPSQARIVFDWEETLKEALTRRVELRRQMWQIKRRELETIAARNFLLPQLDAVALYRWHGFGDDLTGGGGGRFASAFNDLTSGDHQEWQFGLQFNYTFGYRQAWAGLRRSELQLARELAVLKEQERNIEHGLRSSIAEVVRAYKSVQQSFQGLNAATQHRDALAALRNLDNFDLNLFLQAQQRLADAQTQFYLSLSLYGRAVKNVHLQKGSLLEYHGIHLSEGPWPHEAYADAVQSKRRWRPRRIDYRFHYPGPISQGGQVQQASYIEPLPPHQQSIPERAAPEPIPTPQSASRPVGKFR